MEIRKPKILRNTTSNAPEASLANNTQAALSEANPPSPPRPFATPVSPQKPAAPTRPVPRTQSETQEQPPIADLEQTPNPNPAPEKIASQKPEKTVSPRPKSEKPIKPQLVAPPARPEAEVAQVVDEQPVSQADKPILKRDQRQQRPAEGDREQIKPRVAKLPTDQSAPGAPQRTSRPTPAPSRPEQRGNRPSAPSQLGEGQRPRPARPGESVAAAMPIATPPRQMSGIAGKSQGLGDEPVTPPDLLDLKRPSPPRPTKGGKKWVEEEIIDEVKEKAKAGVKGKRIKPILDDEFEEDLLDDDDIDSPATVQVSLSIARPPKPKATRPVQMPGATLASAPTTRGRKSGSRSGSKSSGRDHHQTVAKSRDKARSPEKVTIPGPLTVQELSDVLAVPDTEIVKILFLKGMAVSITQNLDIPTITLVGKN
ncbi:hypothetical protein ANSO36C_30770 [Nostoc cf. commune SO-36]|uniref:Translation initiation factor IF-2 N-terminal domain-containing protein n=1 Tax=Nostoc cf. commune SO-36 TaxID=449208 RepID=A0ABN6Q4P8_NOSCO|nr:hypothetical protein ANSO36C_30770 [Nostoc cf. commune SO-36]